MMEQEMNKELLSALVDGELHGEELEQALACAESAEGCASWEIYHLVGDVLRSPDLAHHSQHDLLSGRREQLAQAASFATVAAVAALGWNLLGTVNAPQGAQLAAAPASISTPVLVATGEGDVLRDPKLDALLANHQQYASRPSLQTPAEFLRNASFAARSSAQAGSK